MLESNIFDTTIIKEVLFIFNALRTGLVMFSELYPKDFSLCLMKIRHQSNIGEKLFHILKETPIYKFLITFKKTHLYPILLMYNA